MLQLKSTDAPPVEMEDLFSIDGVTYQIPRRVTVNVALRYMKLLRTKGQDEALAWAIERVLGESAYDALMNFDGLQPDDLAQVMEVVRDKLLGAVEGPK